jgi:hypothetical protein
MANLRENMPNVPVRNRVAYVGDEPGDFNAPHLTGAMMEEIDAVGARVSSEYEATGLIEAQAFLLLFTRDAWLGAREILRRVALGDPNAVELARVYVALGFGGSSDDEDTVEFLHVDVRESLISSHEEEDDESLS